MSRLCVLVVLALATVAAPVSAQRSPTDATEQIRKRIQWFQKGPWNATDEWGEGILLQHTKFAPHGPIGFMQYFRFHDERPLRVVFVFDGDRVRISQERDAIGANWCLCGRLPIQSEVNKTSWHFEFSPIIDLDGPPHLLRIGLIFEDDDHFTETIAWLDRGATKSQSLHFARNNAGSKQLPDADVAKNTSK